MDKNNNTDQRGQVQITQDAILPGTIKERHLVTGAGANKGDLVYSDANGGFTNLGIGATGALLQVKSAVPNWLAPGSNTQILTISGGVPVWQAPATSLATSLIAYTETVDNSTFTNSYVIVAHVAITLTNNSNVFITATVDVRSSAGGDVVQLNLFNGASALTTNGALSPVGDVSGQRYSATVTYAGALTSGAHTINFKCINASSASTITVGDTQLSLMAIPG